MSTWTITATFRQARMGDLFEVEVMANNYLTGNPTVDTNLVKPTLPLDAQQFGDWAVPMVRELARKITGAAYANIHGWIPKYTSPDNVLWVFEYEVDSPI